LYFKPSKRLLVGAINVSEKISRFDFRHDELIIIMELMFLCFSKQPKTAGYLLQCAAILYFKPSYSSLPTG